MKYNLLKEILHELELSQQEEELFHRYVHVKQCNSNPPLYNVYFKINNQQFTLTQYGLDSKEEACWFGIMFCKALYEFLLAEQYPC